MSIDPFSDERTCDVTTASIYRTTGTYTVTGHLYPFVRYSKDQMMVGVKSGGRFEIPVGDVQLRIDNNDSWSISNIETPIDEQLKTEMATNYETIVLPNLTEEQQKVYEDSYKKAMETATQLANQTLTTYTATTGQKANEILNQMLSGTTLIYRSKGYGAAQSDTGIFELDNSFAKSIARCKAATGYGY
jgi:hypothetical protein